MHRTMGAMVLALLLTGCTDAAPPGEEAGHDAGTSVAAPGTQATGPYDAVNFTRVRDKVYALDDLVVGAAPGTSLLGGHYESMVPAREDTFQVGEHVRMLSFTAESSCGAGSGRVVVHGPEGRPVYASRAWNIVGVPAPPCVTVNEAVEQEEDSFAPGEYRVTYYVAGAIDLRVEVTATYLVPRDGDAA